MTAPPPDAAAGRERGLLDEQQAYYAARASEYDEWWLRAGRYDRGPEFRRRWVGETTRVRAALDAFGARGRVLELACGTGWWTQQLAGSAKAVTALDASQEMLERCRARVEAAAPGPLGAERVRYLRADLWDWTPDRRYDEVCFGFLLSHIPDARFDAFWALVGDALAPGGRVFFVDSAVDSMREAAGPGGPRGPDEAPGIEIRELNDGRRFRIVKHYRQPEPLRARLAGIGWAFEVSRTAEFFVYGQGARAPAA